MFQSRSVVILTLFMLILSAAITNGNRFDYELKDFDGELPLKSDLFIYLESLREILLFCSKNKHEVDMNFEFGLFLVSVNLKKALLKYTNRIPNLLKLNIVHLLQESYELMEYFGYMLKNNNNPRDELNKKISSLFSNETQWISQLDQFDSVPLKKSGASTKRLKGKSSSWEIYYQHVADVAHWTPSPRLSDYCMASLASNRFHNSINSKCKVQAPCYVMLTNGSNFGYALSHRLLFLLNARHSRGCSIFSEEQDKAVVYDFCKLAFDEANFIAMNDFGIIDLFLEQMCLCSMAGYSQFLQRSWLSDVLRYQTKYGCFGQSLPQTKYHSEAPPTLSGDDHPWKLSKKMDHKLMDGQCDGHITSVAASTISSAIRYILETYY